MTLCLEHFFDYDKTYASYQQVNAANLTVNNSMHCLHSVFGDRITSKGLWPPHLPDLNPYYFHMWDLLKFMVMTLELKMTYRQHLECSVNQFHQQNPVHNVFF